MEGEKSREGHIDYSVKPIDKTVIEGVTYTKYHPILVVEGKRLPPPSNARKREYVSGGKKLSGGIQRFKLGLHGGKLSTAIILGYLQQGTLQEWHSRINGWILDLARNQPSDWVNHEILAELQCENQKARTISVHPRLKGCTPEIQILHFWVQLTPI